MTTKAEAAPQIHAAMAAAMREVEAVGKTKRNEQQGYKFRGIDDVYNVVHSALSNQGITTPPRVLDRQKEERQSKNGTVQIHVTLKVEYDFTAPDGSIKTVGPIFAEALDTSDKATNKAMAFAHKYTLLQTFCIPTEDIAEGDKTTVEAAPKRGPEAIPSSPKKEAAELRAKPDVSAKQAEAPASPASLSMEALQEKATELRFRLKKSPNARNAPQVMAYLAEVEEEVRRRQAELQPNPTTGEVPF